MKQHNICNVLKIGIRLPLIVAIILVMGCGEKENKDIIEARAAIVRGDYTAAETAVQRIDAGNEEAQHLRAFLKLRTQTGAENWHQAIVQSNAYLETVATNILTLLSLEDPDSDDLDQQERLIRTRNSISGLFALSLR